MSESRPIRVGLHPSLARWDAEVKYVFRVLLRQAGFAYEFVWAGDTAVQQPLDIYYGPAAGAPPAAIIIPACTRNFNDCPVIEPRSINVQGGLSFLDFGDAHREQKRASDGNMQLANDLVFSSFWLLTGAKEPSYLRDRRDNLHLDGSFFLEANLQSKPLVSQYAAFIRKFFCQKGIVPAENPWAGGDGQAAFAFSHDVDYPQMIRWIECGRLLATRGAKAGGSIAGVLRGTNHFWKFTEWIDFEKKFGARPAFYFMARKGSLRQYAMGTPDDFYDVRTREFRELFAELNDAGCEIGLHASYHAHRSGDMLRMERLRLEEAANVRVEGNRHHYWHLDPADPNETLRRHEEAGLVYDSSLGFEFYPGFRRGVCHPFRVFHTGARRELKVVQIPPTWMDDHFDRRLTKNKIQDPEVCALELIRAAQAAGGAIVVDYHSRGMNSDFYPKYGPWLMQFAEKNLKSGIRFQTPSEIAHAYLEHERALDSRSRDAATVEAPVPISSSGEVSTPAQKPVVGFLQPADEAAWDSFVEAHPHGNIYHSLAWKRVTEEGFGHRPCYLVAKDDSGRVSGLLPLFQVGGIFGSRLVSMPMRDRGGILASDTASARALLERAAELTRELGCKYLELRSLEELDASLSLSPKLICERNWITSRVDLSQGVDVLWKALDKNAVRWAIKNVAKKGVRFEFDSTGRGMNTFYGMFARTRQSMGIPPFPPALFDSIRRHLIEKGKANLSLAWFGDTPIGGMISLLSKDTFIPAYAAPQKEHRKLYPSEFVIWNAMKWAAENGFRNFDFGADSPRQIGLLRFKRKWGSTQHAMHYYYFLNGISAPPSFDSTSPVYAAARTAWRWFPAPVSKRLGSWVTRQLS